MVASHTREPTPAVELYVRSLAPRTGRARLRRTVDRLVALEGEGCVADVTVRVTGKAIPATPGDALTDYGAFLCNRVFVFREWATQTDRSLDSCFERRHVHSAFTDEEYDAIVWPELLLAEYVDGALRFVAPCEGDGDPVTVDDRLGALERAEAPAESDRLSHARADPPAEFSPAPEPDEFSPAKH